MNEQAKNEENVLHVKQNEEQQKKSKQERLPLPTIEYLRDALRGNNGILGEMLIECVGREMEMSDDMFSFFDNVYGRVNNKAVCPCGKSKLNYYQDCCKPIWQILRRNYRSEEKRKKNLEKQSARMVKQLQEVKKLVTIGINPIGMISFEWHEEGRKMQLGDMASLLYKASQDVYTQLVIRITDEHIHKAMSLARNNKGPFPGM